MRHVDDVERLLPESLGNPQGSIEEQLRETRQQFLGLFYDAPVACHEIDSDGIVVRVNSAEGDLLGFAPAEMIGRPIWEFMALEERESSSESVRRKLSGDQPLTKVERKYTRRDGTIIFLEIHPKLILSASGEIIGIRSFMIDISARKQVQHALERQAAELARSNGELEQFAYVASHDLQEPLRKILAFGDRLKTTSGDQFSPEARDYLTRMQNAATRMQTLIHDLLALSRVATQPHPFGPVDLRDTVTHVLSDFESKIERVQGRVEVGVLPAIIADRLQMAQLFQNLIGNALKFQKPGEPPVVRISSEYVSIPEKFAPQRKAVAGSLAPSEEATASCGASEEVPCCRIVVEDNGIGFEDKHAGRIFQVFQRLHGRGEYDGSGIGLSICRKIAERHGGSITASGQPGSGAKFTVTLPLRPVEGDMIP
jgi:PAS domain S-box-containing protein